MNTATIVTNGTVANSKQCSPKRRTTVETRVNAHQEHIDKLVWTVEWRKNPRSEWKKYCKCYTAGSAETHQRICQEWNGGYPVIHEDRWRTTKFRVLNDYGHIIDSTVRVEYKQGLGKWHSFGNYADLSVAKEVIGKVKSGARKLNKYGGRKFIHDFCKTCESTVLCIRFPFLYPRNRFSGKHYNDWELLEKLEHLHEEGFELTNPVKFHKGMTDEEMYEINHPKYRIVNYQKAIGYRVLLIWNAIKRFFHIIPTYTELDAMDRGWRKAFGIDICKEIKKALKKEHYLRKYRIMQIKEKWGELCWYDAGAPQSVFDIIRKYETISYNTCIECGKPAKYRSTGWVEPYCEDCLPQSIREQGNYRLKTEDSGWVEIGIPEL